MKKFIRTLWGMAIIVCLSLLGCEKFPEGQGELIVKVDNSGKNRVVVQPSDGGPSIARSDILKEGWNTVSFTLNAGNGITLSIAGILLRNMAPKSLKGSLSQFIWIKVMFKILQTIR